MNLREILDMGGYGFYVWGSYIITAIAMGGELLLLRRRRRSLLSQVDQNAIFEGKTQDENPS